MGKQVFLALAIFFWPYLVWADSISSLRAGCSLTPDTKAWTVMNKSRIEVRVSETVIVYLGLDVEYRNPANTNEFVRVVSQHIPLVLVMQTQRDQKLAREVAVTLYNQKEEEERLNDLENKTDPVIYIQWRTRKDALTGKEFPDGDVDIWLMLPKGDCYFTKNRQVQVEFLSENVGNGKSRNVLVGRRYEVDGRYHMIKADRNDIKNLVEGVE